MQKIYPDFLLWNVWKIHAANVFDDAKWSPRLLWRTIWHDLFLWAKSRNRTKLGVSDPRFIQLGLSPPLWSNWMRILCWSPPSTGRLKFNTDVVVGRPLAGGAAIVWDSAGRFVHASSYTMRHDFPFRIKAQAVLMAIAYICLYLVISLSRSIVWSW